MSIIHSNVLHERYNDEVLNNKDWIALTDISSSYKYAMNIVHWFKSLSEECNPIICTFKTSGDNWFNPISVYDYNRNMWMCMEGTFSICTFRGNVYAPLCSKSVISLQDFILKLQERNSNLICVLEEEDGVLTELKGEALLKISDNMRC